MRFNAVIGTLVLMVPMIYAELPTMKDYLPDNLYKWVFFVVVIVNIYLRTRTTQPVTLK